MLSMHDKLIYISIYFLLTCPVRFLAFNPDRIFGLEKRLCKMAGDELVFGPVQSKMLILQVTLHFCSLQVRRD